MGLDTDTLSVTHSLTHTCSSSLSLCIRARDRWGQGQVGPGTCGARCSYNTTRPSQGSRAMAEIHRLNTRSADNVHNRLHVQFITLCEHICPPGLGGLIHQLKYKCMSPICGLFSVISIHFTCKPRTEQYIYQCFAYIFASCVVFCYIF